MALPNLFRSLREERASGRLTTVRDWIAAHPLPAEHFRLTLAGVPDRVNSGDSFADSVKEFLDEFSFRPAELRLPAIAERPPLIGIGYQDAYLAAVAEHLAGIHGLPCPSWPAETERFCDQFWFASDVKGFRAEMIATSPAAFRRRGLFVSRRALDRI